MAKMAPMEMRQLALVGARARLLELKAELSALVKAFPEIGSASGAVPSAGKRRKPGRKSPMSAAERKAVSERMKKYWAGRRAAKAKK